MTLFRSQNCSRRRSQNTVTDRTPVVLAVIAQCCRVGACAVEIPAHPRQEQLPEVEALRQKASRYATARDSTNCQCGTTKKATIIALPSSTSQWCYLMVVGQIKLTGLPQRRWQTIRRKTRVLYTRTCFGRSLKGFACIAVSKWLSICNGLSDL